MPGYQKPKRRLHRDFAYLQHDAVLNSLSAIEAGKVDEIIEKTSEATDRGVEAGLGKGPIKAGGARKRHAEMQMELVKTRTWFSGFDAWHQALSEQDALGKFDQWNLGVRTELEVGDTIEFTARVQLSPLFLMLTNYLSFVEKINKPGSVFKMSGKELNEAKQTALMMTNWVRNSTGGRSITAYFAPAETDHPRIVGRLDDQYVIGGLDKVQGTYTVIAQLDSKLEDGDRMSALRVLSDVPPTPMEISTVENGLKNFQGEAAEGLGIDLLDDDLIFTHPTVIIRPIAMYK